MDSIEGKRRRQALRSGLPKANWGGPAWTLPAGKWENGLKLSRGSELERTGATGAKISRIGITNSVLVLIGISVGFTCHLIEHSLDMIGGLGNAILGIFEMPLVIGRQDATVTLHQVG